VRITIVLHHSLLVLDPPGACEKIFNFLLFLDTKVGRPLWREDGSVICIAVNLWSRSLRTRNHTLLSYPRLAHFYTWTLGSLSVTTYDSQVYGWGILTLLPTGITELLKLKFKLKFKLCCNRRSAGHFVLGSGPLWGPRLYFHFLCLTITFFLLHVGRPLWWEDGSVICHAITHWLVTQNP
jgi:hypothetical protein